MAKDRYYTLGCGGCKCGKPLLVSFDGIDGEFIAVFPTKELAQIKAAELVTHGEGGGDEPEVLEVEINTLTKV